MEKYEDIINLSRPVSNGPKMSLEQRSAQFAPFAALTGYEGQVKETARITENKIEIDEELKMILDLKIQILLDRIKEKPLIKITYFVPDEKKDGGKYVNIEKNVIKIDQYNNTIILSGNISIPMNEIIDIRGDIVKNIDNIYNFE